MLAGPGQAGLVLTGLLSCGSERYTRPPGPAPRYESAPLAPWTNGATPVPGTSEDDALESESQRALAGDAGVASGSSISSNPTSSSPTSSSRAPGDGKGEATQKQ